MGNVLYRKYRSRTLDEIVGQKHITDTLKNAIKNGRIGHAYLLTGPRGVGKTSIARILAREVNELDHNTEENHLDIIEIDAASNRRIDEVRDLRDKVHIAPAQAKYKVYIVDEVHMLTKEAFNALLKTLEEPPAHVIFILATTEIHKLPETIISRTQRFTFKPIGQKVMEGHLADIAEREGIKINSEALELIAAHGTGSFRDSLGLLDQARHTQSEKGVIERDNVASLLGIPPDTIVQSIMNSIDGKTAATLMQTISDIQAQGYDPSVVAAHVSRRIRENIQSTGATTTETLRLLKSLLEVPSSSEPLLSLELALLESITDDIAVPTTSSLAETQNKQSTLENEPPKQNAKPANTPQKKEAPESKPKEKTAKSIKRTNTTPASPKAVKSEGASKSLSSKEAKEVWNQVLEELKGRHNTLYGMARVVKVRRSNDSFVLECKYAFHAKRLSDSQHKKTLEGYLHKLTGEALSIMCVVAEKTDTVDRESTRPPVATKQKHTDAISNVSNIFGGAEVLES